MLLSMKKFMLMSLVAICATLCLSSCSNGESECVSCVNSHEYVMKNESVFRNYSREEWLLLPDSLKTSVYSAMTADCKYLFWQDKIRETKTLKWSAEELEHIERLESFINANNRAIFSKGASNDSTIVRIMRNFSIEWLEYSSKNFGWTRSIQFCIAASGEPLTDNMLSAMRNGLEMGKGIVDSYCNCSTKSNWCLKRAILIVIAFQKAMVVVSFSFIDVMEVVINKLKKLNDEKNKIIFRIATCHFNICPYILFAEY